MRRTILIALGIGAVITSAAALGIGSALDKDTGAMNRIEFESALADLEAARPAALARCEGAPGAEKEICRAQAGADEMVRVADLEHGFRRSHVSARDAQRARIEARYQVSRARCGAVAGPLRDRCFIAAHATRGRALLDSQHPYERRS